MAQPDFVRDLRFGRFQSRPEGKGIHVLDTRQRYTGYVDVTQGSGAIEGICFGMLLCVPFWTAVLLLILR
jgi:hypothetical protein